MAFNENTRVKIPAILHLCGLGYTYLSLSDLKLDLNTNIAVDIFNESIKRINPELDESEVRQVYDKVFLNLSNEDLGKAFYEQLVSTSTPKLIDFQNIENNSFHVVTELTFKNGDDEFRPDVILLVNGMPLAFIEVKKPNNRDGILAERDRIDVRFKNTKFRKFINMLQILMFSNNMEYDSEAIVPIQGAFYSTTSYTKANFNPFREEEQFDLSKILKPVTEEIENFVLKDNNLTSIKFSPEFIENKNPTNPTNRLVTSIFSKERFIDLLRYGIAYVENSIDGKPQIEKHIMRYPQFFATKAIKKHLDQDKRKGIIWHTQGSGKTALAYYNVKFLTDYFNAKGIVPKFYFIVDRLDLMTQADIEFTNRGLKVHTVNSRDELVRDFKTNKAIFNFSGKPEITVVNIQKFEDETTILKETDYDTNIQRIYFLDEVHRSYNPQGSFLANLFNSDKKAILIGLTGTPLISKDYKSRDIFGEYIHKYYYNASIADGYTLKLIREGIETNYRIRLEEILKEIEVLKGDVERKVIYAHEKFVEPMLDYIVTDLEKSRIMLGDKTIGAMVVCDSSDQAKQMAQIFANKYSNRLKAHFERQNDYTLNTKTSEFIINDGNSNDPTGTLILHDSGNKDSRKQAVEDFKAGKIDILFVYNMLLTGFDAKRLKKLYIGRVIKDHNLLQTLTRVNRPYKDFKYGFVVDFADIRKEFEATNRAYFEELQLELGDEMQNYSNLFMSKEDIENEIANIKERLFEYDLKNSEIFSQQITQIEDKKKVTEIKKALESAKNLYNIIRLYGHYELLEQIDFRKLQEIYNETINHLNLLNLKESLASNSNTVNLLNVALENVVFAFRKVSEDELVLADELKGTLAKTREVMNLNIDKEDPEFVSLYEELKRLFGNKNLSEITQEEMKQNITALKELYRKINELNRRNSLLQSKYGNDSKYVRIHKRVREKQLVSQKESEIFELLKTVKANADEKVLINQNLLNNESYFNGLMMKGVTDSFDASSINLEPESARFVNAQVVKEYLNEFKDR